MIFLIFIIKLIINLAIKYNDSSKSFIRDRIYYLYWNFVYYSIISYLLSKNFVIFFIKKQMIILNYKIAKKNLFQCFS